VLLPNSPDVLITAERAAELSEKAVAVVPSRSPQAGLAVAGALDPTCRAAENADAMVQALARVRTAAVAPAARDDAQGRFRAGEAVGLVDEQVVAWGSPEHALGAVVAALAREAELISCLRGADAPLDDEAVRALVLGGTELELLDGGQPSWWWLLSAE
ncbi:MAG: hypothetical protein ACRDL8_18610, partial [Solirubrobacteraceae bacterium]